MLHLWTTFAVTRGHQKDSGNDRRDVDVTESGFQDRTCGTDVTMLLGSLKYESKRSSFPKFQGSEYSCGDKSYAQRSRRQECYTAGKKNVNSIAIYSSFQGYLSF